MEKTLFLFAIGMLASLRCTGGTSPIDQTPGSVSGFVANARDSGAVSGAVVALVGQLQETPTDSTGYFELSDIPPGDQVLSISKDGYIFLSFPAAIPPGELLRLDTVFLAPSEGAIAISVEDGVSGDAVQDAAVYLLAPPYHWALDSGETDVHGEFQFESVPVDTNGYRLRITKSGYEEATTQCTVSKVDTTMCAAVLYPIIAKDYLLYDAVMDCPAADVPVNFMGNALQSDSLGLVSLAVSTGFDSGFCFQIDNPFFGNPTICDTIEDSLDILDTIFLQRLSGNLRGQYRLQGRNSHHEGVIVSIGALGATDTTDTLGNFAFSALPAGKWQIQAECSDFSLKTDSVEVPGDGTALFEGELIVETGFIASRVDWTADYSPYRIIDQLTILSGGSLNIESGTEIQLIDNATVACNENGIVRCTGYNESLVTVNSGSSGNTSGTFEVRADGGAAVLRFAMFKDVEVICIDGPKIAHCLIVHTDQFESDTGVRILPSEQGTIFDHCDFIRLQSSITGIFVQDSLFPDSAGLDSVVFSNCIFSQYTAGLGASAFLTSDNTGNVVTKLTNCDLYADNTIEGSMLRITDIDTTNIWQLEPEYVDPQNLDFYLLGTSPMLDKSINFEYNGALGTVPVHGNQ